MVRPHGSRINCVRWMMIWDPDTCAINDELRIDDYLVARKCWTASSMDEELSATQRLLRAILPSRWFQQIEAESREWIMTCSQCGAEQSIWDAGGVRWKAQGERVFHARCTRCGKTSAHKVAQWLTRPEQP